MLCQLGRVLVRKKRTHGSSEKKPEVLTNCGSFIEFALGFFFHLNILLGFENLNVLFLIYVNKFWIT
jgi:hypothetical protein